MSALGEYVHYSWSNYRKYGLNRKRKGQGVETAIQIFQQQKQAMLNKIPKKENKHQIQLENALSNAIYPMANNSQISSQLHKNLELLCGNLLVAWGGENSLAAIKQNNQVSTNQYFSLSNLVARKNQAISILNAIGSNLPSNVKRYEQLTIQLQQLIDDITKVEASVSNVSNNALQTVKYSLNDPSLKNTLIPRINETLLKIAHHSMFKATGDLFENAIASMDDRLSKNINHVSDNLIKEILVGEKGINVKPVSKVESYQVNTRTSLGQKVDQGFSADIGYTDGDGFKVVSKVDIQLQYQDEQYNISAKNYSLKNNNSIHLLSSSGLLDILLKNVNTNFINHYLNIVTSKGHKSSNVEQMAHQAAKSIVAIEAITGLSQRGGGADYLIVNNRSQKRVSVIPMYRIINHKNWEQFYSIVGYKESDIKKNNIFEDSTSGKKYDFLAGKIRIDKLLSELHKIKISASLNSMALNQLGI